MDDIMSVINNAIDEMLKAPIERQRQHFYLPTRIFEGACEQGYIKKKGCDEFATATDKFFATPFPMIERDACIHESKNIGFANSSRKVNGSHFG